MYSIVSIDIHRSRIRHIAAVAFAVAGAVLGFPELFLVASVSEPVKGVCHEIFDLYFFMIQTIHGPLTNRLTSPRNSDVYIISIVRNFSGVTNTQYIKKLPGMHHSAESIFAVCIAPQSQSPRCASHPRVKLNTAESKSKSSLVSGCF